MGDGLTGWLRTTHSTPFLPALRILDIPFTLGNSNFTTFFSLSFLVILLFLKDEVQQSLTTIDIHEPLVPPINQPSTLSFTTDHFTYAERPAVLPVSLLSQDIFSPRASFNAFIHCVSSTMIPGRMFMLTSTAVPVASGRQSVGPSELFETIE